MSVVVPSGSAVVFLILTWSIRPINLAWHLMIHVAEESKFSGRRIPL